jgi:hypothetical protein
MDQTRFSRIVGSSELSPQALSSTPAALPDAKIHRQRRPFMRHESVTDDGHVVLEEECGCAASNGFFKTCERHDDLKTLSEMNAYLALRKSLLKSAAEAQEKFNEGSRERYNKRARLRERTKAQSEPPNND